MFDPGDLSEPFAVPTLTAHTVLRDHERLMWLLVRRWHGWARVSQEELFQALAADVLENFRTFDPTLGSVGTWLGVRVRHAAQRCRAHEKRHEIRPLSQVLELSEATTFNPVDGRDDFGVTEYADEAIWLRELVATLPEPERIAVEARFGLGGTKQTWAKLADSLGCSVPRATGIYESGMAKLRQRAAAAEHGLRSRRLVGIPAVDQSPRQSA